MQTRAATAYDWNTSPMPDKHAEFSFRRFFTKEEMELLRFGNIPQEMEDKWFWYYEDDRLYIHRSWTGFCICIVRFTPGSDELHVTVNRDPEQYSCTDVNEDQYELNRLLGWWTQPDYIRTTSSSRTPTARCSRRCRRTGSRPSRRACRAICSAAQQATRWDIRSSS